MQVRMLQSILALWHEAATAKRQREQKATHLRQTLARGQAERLLTTWLNIAKARRYRSHPLTIALHRRIVDLTER